MQIGEYEVENLTTKNAGFSKWGFAVKEGKTYFIKEFLSPVYPVSGKLSEKQIRQKKENCAAYEQKMRRVYEAVNGCSDGNLVRIQHFFRCKSKYYIVTEKIDAISMGELQKLPEQNREKICLILLHSVYCLHRAGMVHGDLKPDNILFQRLPSGFHTAKVIDFDTCFREKDEQNPSEEIHCDPVYMAPETWLRAEREEGRLTAAIDVFALGLIFHQILSGSLPTFSIEYDYPCMALLNGGELYLNARIRPEMRTLIEKMTVPDPEKRITLAEAFLFFGFKAPEHTEAETKEDASGGGPWYVPGKLDVVPEKDAEPAKGGSGEKETDYKSKLRGDLARK